MRTWISGRLPIDTLLAFAFGVVFLAITILLEVFLGGEETRSTIRVTLALAAAGIGAGIPGLLNFNASTDKGLAIKGSGALVLFLVVYLVNPLSTQPNAVPDIEQFTVEPSRIIPGQAVTIAWRARNADIVRLRPLNKEWQNDQSVNDSVTTSPITNTTYVLELLVKGAPVATREATVVVSLPVCTAKAEQIVLRTGPGERFPEVIRLNKRVKLVPIDYSTLEYQPDGRVVQSEWMHVRWEGENGEGWAPAADLDCPSGILEVLSAASTLPPTPTVTPTPTSPPTATATPTSSATPAPTPTFTLTPLPPKIVSFTVLPTEVVPGQVVLITFAFENADQAELLASPAQIGTQPELLPIGGGKVSRDLADQIQHRPVQATTYELILKDGAGTVLAKRRSRVDLVAPACVVTTTNPYENLQLRSGPGTLYANVPSKSNSDLPVLLPNGTRVTALGYTLPTGLEREGVAFTWIKIEYQTSDGLQEGWVAWTFLKCAVDYVLLPLIAKDNWPPTPTPRAQATPTATPSPMAASVTPLPPAPPATPQPSVVFGPYQVVSSGEAGCTVWQRAFQLPDARMILDTSQGDGLGYALLVVRYQPRLDSLGPGTIEQLGGMQPPVLETTIGANGREEVRVTVPVCPTRLVQNSSLFGASRVRWVDHLAVFEIQLFGRYP